jgi:hypothetical protein
MSHVINYYLNFTNAHSFETLLYVVETQIIFRCTTALGEPGYFGDDSMLSYHNKIILFRNLLKFFKF